MVSQDSQSQAALVSMDTASDGGPFFSAPHYSFTQHPLLPLFISLQDELKGQRNWNCGAIRKRFFSDGDILTTPSGSSRSQHTGWEFVEVQMRVSVFRVYKECLGTCQSHHFCALAQPRLNCTCTHILFQLAQERNCSPSADSVVITASSGHICYPNTRKSCDRTLIIWNSQIRGCRSLA